MSYRTVGGKGLKDGRRGKSEIRNPNAEKNPKLKEKSTKREEAPPRFVL